MNHSVLRRVALFAAPLLLAAAALADNPEDLVGQARALQSRSYAVDQRGPGVAAPVCTALPGDGHGLLCQLDGGAYPQKVAFYFSSWPPSPDAEIVLYLHGIKKKFEGADGILDYFKLGTRLADSGRLNTILVVPDGTGPNLANETFSRQWRKAPDQGKLFRAFMAGVMRAVAAWSGAPVPAAAPRRLVLAAHSGGGYTVTHIVGCSDGAICYGRDAAIDEIYLFDAAYNPDEGDPQSLLIQNVLAEYARQPGHRLASVVFGTVEHNAQLWTNIEPGSRRTENFARLGQTTKTDPQSLSGPAVFIGTQVGHNETVRDFFKILLKK